MSEDRLAHSPTGGLNQGEANALIWLRGNKFTPAPGGFGPMTARPCCGKLSTWAPKNCEVSGEGTTHKIGARLASRYSSSATAC